MNQDEEEPVEQKLECVLKELARVNIQGFSYVLCGKRAWKFNNCGSMRTKANRIELLWKEKKKYNSRKSCKIFFFMYFLIHTLQVLFYYHHHPRLCMEKFFFFGNKKTFKHSHNVPSQTMSSSSSLGQKA